MITEAPTIAKSLLHIHNTPHRLVHQHRIQAFDSRLQGVVKLHELSVQFFAKFLKHFINSCRRLAVTRLQAASHRGDAVAQLDGKVQGNSTS